MLYTIYRTDCLTTGEYYIGYHGTENPDDSYLGSGTGIKKRISEIGKVNFKKTVLHVFDNEDDMIAKEIELVTKELIKEFSCLNRATGGKGGRKGAKFFCKPEIRELLYLKMKTPEYKEMMSKLVRSRDQLVFDKISASMKKAHARGAFEGVSEKIRRAHRTPETAEKRLMSQKLAILEGRLDIQARNRAISDGQKNSEAIKKRNLMMKDMRWLTDENRNVRVNPDRIQEFLLQGWRFGKVRLTKN